ncbi:MAG TPA: hypothetical protein VEQ10_12625 [Vicinamibacteria bacterium]|nr:hypothetical protein [Vicinamibacteria bacterium]
MPSAVARGWDGMPMILAGRPDAMPAAARPQASSMLAGLMSPFRSRRNALDGSPDLAFGGLKRGGVRGAARGRSVRPLDELMVLQSADGSWELGPELAKALAIPRERLQALERRVREAARQERSTEDLPGVPLQRVLATMLALRWLARHCAASRDEWRLAADKSEAWLQQYASALGSWLQRLLDEAGL